MTFLNTATRVHTSREIAAALDVPWSRVRWILTSRSIPTVGVVGITKIYDDLALERVRVELQKQDERPPAA